MLFAHIFLDYSNAVDSDQLSKHIHRSQLLQHHFFRFPDCLNNSNLLPLQRWRNFSFTCGPGYLRMSVIFITKLTTNMCQKDRQ